MGLCAFCPHRDSIRAVSWIHDWFWCKVVENIIHISMSCRYRREEIEPKRVPLAVRLGLKPNEQGEYLA